LILMSIHTQSLHCGGERVAVKNRIDAFYDITRNLEEISLVLQRHQRPARTVVHPDLERLYQRSEGFDIALDAQISKYQKASQHRLFLDGRVDRNDEGDPCFTWHVVAEQVYAFNIEIRGIHLLRNAYLDLLRC